MRNFKKMKVAKFEIKKKYQKKILEELVDEAIAARERVEKSEDFDM